MKMFYVLGPQAEAAFSNFDRCYTSCCDKSPACKAGGSSNTFFNRLILPLLATLLGCVTLLSAYGVAAAEVIETDTPNAGDLHVVIKTGDSLGSILYRELESIQDLELVARENKIAEPDKVSPGEVIVIPYHVVQKRNFARVAYVKGAASLVRVITRKEEQVKKGLKIFIGDAIKTGDDGFVSLSFRDSSLVNIQPNSEVLVEQLECFDKELSCVIQLHATEGELSLDVGQADFLKPTVFTIDTPFASAAVRGTRFDFDIRDGNVLGVTEGEVEISFAGESSVVPLGKGTLAGEGLSVTTIYDLLSAPEFLDYVDFDRVSEEDILQWGEVGDADRYVAAFATDALMSNVITTVAKSVSEPEATVALSNVGPGDYFFAVRAIDKNGLRGFSSQKKLRHVEIAKDDGPDLDIEVIDQKMEVRSDSRNLLEVRVGNELQFVEGLDRLMRYQTYQLEPGGSLELDVKDSQEWYLTAREILSERSVSRYGGLYEYKAER